MCNAVAQEILGRVYRAGDGAFHKLCMICSVCNKQSKEGTLWWRRIESVRKYDLLFCGDCVAVKGKLVVDS
jgi:hypothetical protein